MEMMLVGIGGWAGGIVTALVLSAILRSPQQPSGKVIMGFRGGKD